MQVLRRCIAKHKQSQQKNACQFPGVINLLQPAIINDFAKVLFSVFSWTEYENVSSKKHKAKAE